MDLTTQNDQQARPSDSGRRSKRTLPLAAPVLAGLSSSSRQNNPSNRRSTKKQKTAPPNELTVACPLFVRDPVLGFDCISFRFRRPGDVVQHVRRSHALGNYCADCYKEFDTEADRDDHVRLRQCTQRNLPPNAVLPAMLEKLPRTGSLETKWFRLYDILFPNDGHPRPSPFIYGDSRDAIGVVRRMERNRCPEGSPTSSMFNRRLASLEGLDQDSSDGSVALAHHHTYGPGFESSMSMSDVGLMTTEDMSTLSFPFGDFLVEDNEPSISGN